MIKKTVSKCGARFSLKKEISTIVDYSEKPVKQFEEEKPVQKKTVRSWTRKTPKIEVGDFANIEDEI